MSSLILALGAADVVESIRISNYAALTVITVIVYDYVLTIPREINYVWLAHWTWVSILYILSRYLGLFIATSQALLASYFLLGSAKVSAGMYLASGWATPVFIAASELVMILRVYAMWNRSKTILVVLLFAYVPQVVFAIITASVYARVSYRIFHVPDHGSICHYLYSNDAAAWYISLPFYWGFIVLSFSILLLILAVFRTSQQSISMYKATKQWQPNEYTKLLVKDGMLFFILTMLPYVAFIPVVSGNDAPIVILQSLSYLYYGPLIPRLIINVRELYDRELRARSQGIDTGFGILSHPTSNGYAAVSNIVFAEAVAQQDQETEEHLELIEVDTQV